MVIVIYSLSKRVNSCDEMKYLMIFFAEINL